MELTTELNGSDVLVVYEVDHDTAVCYNSATGCDYEEAVYTATVESVMFKGVDILAVISESDLVALEMECQAACDEVAV